MWHYKALHPGNYYLIQEHELGKINLVYVQMATEKCVLVEYQDEERNMEWYRKDDELFEVIEQLSEELAMAYENIFEVPAEYAAGYEWDEDDWEDLEDEGEVWELTDEGDDEDDEDESSRLN